MLRPMASPGTSNGATIAVVVGVVVLVGLAIWLLSGGHIFFALLAACGAIATVAGYAMLRA